MLPWRDHRPYLVALAYALIAPGRAPAAGSAEIAATGAISRASRGHALIAARAAVEAVAPPEGDAAAVDENADAPSDEVPRTPTPLTEIELARVLREGHRAVFGEDPSDLRLSVAWAHLAYEHGRGSLVECNNLGNLSLDDATPGRYFLRTKLKERRRKNPREPFGKWRWLDIRFYAFASPVEGACAYWRHLDRHYGKALALFSAGAAGEAARNLAVNGWATAPPERYEKAIRDLRGEYMRRIYSVMRAEADERR